MEFLTILLPISNLSKTLSCSPSVLIALAVGLGPLLLSITRTLSPYCASNIEHTEPTGP